MYRNWANLDHTTIWYWENQLHEGSEAVLKSIKVSHYLFWPLMTDTIYQKLSIVSPEAITYCGFSGTVFRLSKSETIWNKNQLQKSIFTYQRPNSDTVKLNDTTLVLVWNNFENQFHCKFCLRVARENNQIPKGMLSYCM